MNKKNMSLVTVQFLASGLAVERAFASHTTDGIVMEKDATCTQIRF